MKAIPFQRATPVAAALAATMLMAGCGASPAAPAEHTVAVAKAVRRHLANSMTFQAELAPFQDVIVHAKVSGYVNPIRVDIGDRVRAGDLIATLEVPELRDQLASAQASERRAEAEHGAASLDYQRLSGVNREHANLVAQQELDNAQARDGATAASVAAAQADADRLKTLVDYTRVTAPFDGIVTRRFVDNGALVEAGTSSGAGPIVEIAEIGVLRLRFPVPESVTPMIEVGVPVRVSVDALHRSFQGKVARAAWAIDRSTRTMVAEVDVPNPDGAFKAGMYATVTLDTQKAEGVLSVPLQALGRSDPPTLLVARNGVIEERRAELGMRTASFAEVRSGLADGDLVVVGDRAGLEPGSAVTTREVEAGPDQDR